MQAPHVLPNMNQPYQQQPSFDPSQQQSVQRPFAPAQVCYHAGIQEEYVYHPAKIREFKSCEAEGCGVNPRFGSAGPWVGGASQIEKSKNH